MAALPGRLATTCVLLAATLLAPVRAHSGPAAPTCTTLGTSLTFATDQTIFCGTGAANPGGSDNYLDVYRSVNAGRTWAGPFHVAAVKSQGGVVAIFVSPNYRVDGTLFVGTTVGGYVSRDRGETFTLLTTLPVAYPVTSVYLDRPVKEMAPYPSLITIPLTTDPGPCCPRVFDWLTPGGRPVLPNFVDWVFARHYIVPPDLSEVRQAVMVGRPGLWNENDPVPHTKSGHAKAYSCDASFNCVREIYDFAPPPGMADTRIRFTGSTYSGSADTYVVTYSDPTRPSVQAFRSPDRGLTWAPWTSVNKLVAGLPWSTNVMAVASPDAPKRLFLSIAADDSGLASVPDQRLFRSDDNGATWRQIGYAWGPTQHARSKSTLPWNSGGYAWQPPVVAPGGRLLVPAARRTGGWGTIGRQVTQGMYCSRDYGRSWLRSC